MHIKIATAIFLSLAFSSQPRGWVSSVTAEADGLVGTAGTYQFTVRGNNPCGAVNVDFGDGTTATTHAIQQLPFLVPHEFTKIGEYRVRARGMGNCDGDVFTSVNVTRVSSRWLDRNRPATDNRFSEMDQNRDGVITRAEWRGTAQAFDEADWNNDNRLSGDEVRTGVTVRFGEMDQNRDGIITRAEWRGGAQAFDRFDWNNDGRLSGEELRVGATPPAPAAAIRFAEMDRNRDGVITRAEWRGTAQAFEVNDWNNDGRLSGDEVRVGAERQFDWTEAQFRRFDRNRDNYLSGTEWRYEADDFQQVDRNRDDRVSLAEFLDGDNARRAGNNGRGRGWGRGRGNQDSPDPSVTVRVTNRVAWTDTGLDVRAGDTLNIDASGTIQFSTKVADTAGPQGSPGHRATAAAPMPNRNIGALIARVGNSAPFMVGDDRNALRVSQTGRLFLGVNDDNLRDNSGEFRVIVSVNRGR